MIFTGHYDAQIMSSCSFEYNTMCAQYLYYPSESVLHESNNISLQLYVQGQALPTLHKLPYLYSQREQY